jgi:pyrimidine operon attenuation protein / uracil phosphoribosyltransferase
MNAPMRPQPPDQHLVEMRKLLDAEGIARTLRRLAHEIVERAGGTGDLVLVGIRTGGAFLAARLQKLIREAEGVAIPVGAVDITLYRDDVFHGLPKPVVGPTEIPGTLEGKLVVLVDDVLYTGRTVRAALDALVEFGRPRAVRLAVLVDRGHREFPIQADHVGVTVETTRAQSVRVLLSERGEEDLVSLREKATT